MKCLDANAVQQLKRMMLHLRLPGVLQGGVHLLITLK